MNRLIDRMIRAARLDASLYEEVEHDESATTQALLVVAARQALDYTSTLRAVGVCVMGWIAMTLVSLMLGGFAYLP